MVVLEDVAQAPCSGRVVTVVLEDVGGGARFGPHCDGCAGRRGVRVPVQEPGKSEVVVAAASGIDLVHATAGQGGKLLDDGAIDEDP